MLGLTTGLVMLLGTMTALPVSADTANSGAVQDRPVTLEAHVRDYFSDTPILAEVAKCESGFQQFGRDGKVLRGMAVRKDVGLLQINEGYHGETAKALGYNIYSVDGNMAYAKYLYEKQGTDPWSASKKCWSKAEKALALNK